ncbi:MAG TPA: restriction endonuclease, partial [Candidatus Faecousia intestinavium]|nr:restriction endonuclease [Candidatus Faecousia intestinavium]
YAFEEELILKHPDNHNIRAKIRQQLQQLRNRGIILFLGNGQYQKISKAD